MGRRRSIYDAGTFTTPLGDFLEKIPDYFIRWEQLKQAESEREEAKDFRNLQYSNAIAQQQKDNEYRQTQALNQERNRVFDNHTKLMHGMSDVQKVQYIDKVIKKDDTLKDYMDWSEFDDFSSTVTDANTEYDIIDAKVDGYRGTSDFNNFKNYQDIAKDYERLQGMEKSVRGTDLEESVATDIEYLGGLKKLLETSSGREMAVKDMSPTQQVLFNKLNDSFGIAQKSYMESELAMAEIGELQEVIVDGKKVEKWMPLPLTGKMVTGTEKRNFAQKERAFRLAMNKRNRLESDLKKFTKDNNLFYPEITTCLLYTSPSPRD